MNYNRVLSELWRIVFIQPVVVFGKVALLGDPELDGIVFYSDEAKSNASKACYEE